MGATMLLAPAASLGGICDGPGATKAKDAKETQQTSECYVRVEIKGTLRGNRSGTYWIEAKSKKDFEFNPGQARPHGWVLTFDDHKELKELADKLKDKMVVLKGDLYFGVGGPNLPAPPLEVDVYFLELVGKQERK